MGSYRFWNNVARVGNGLTGLLVAKSLYDNPALIWDFGPDCALHLLNTCVSEDSSDLLKGAATAFDIVRFLFIQTTLARGQGGSATTILQIDRILHGMSAAQNAVNLFRAP